MSVVTMVILATIVVALPLILMLAFNGRNEADSSGRRISHTWRTKI